MREIILMLDFGSQYEEMLAAMVRLLKRGEKL